MPFAFVFNSNVPHQVPWIYISTSNNVHLWLYWTRVVLRIENFDTTIKRVTNETLVTFKMKPCYSIQLIHVTEDWGEPTCTLVPCRQWFRYPTRIECMGWFAQINFWGLIRTSQSISQSNLAMYWMGRYLPGMVVDIQQGTGWSTLLVI
jgi:hypothetical protein